MSTKMSLKSGPNFHLYTDYAVDDAKSIVLELDNAEFECSKNSVTVVIPPEIWETIRQHTPVSFRYADKTDEEILQEVTDFVHKRLQDVGIVRSCGLFIYGSADDPVEEQIQSGVAHFKATRAYEQGIRQKIEAMR